MGQRVLARGIRQNFSNGTRLDHGYQLSRVSLALIAAN